MYERAVLRKPVGKTFGATVDLWSIGTNFYSKFVFRSLSRLYIELLFYQESHFIMLLPEIYRFAHSVGDVIRRQCTFIMLSILLFNMVLLKLMNVN